MLATNDAEVLGEGGCERLDLVRDLFVDEGGYKGAGDDRRLSEGSREPSTKGLYWGKGGGGGIWKQVMQHYKG